MDSVQSGVQWHVLCNCFDGLGFEDKILTEEGVHANVEVWLVLQPLLSNDGIHKQLESYQDVQKLQRLAKAQKAIPRPVYLDHFSERHRSGSLFLLAIRSQLLINPTKQL
jgi:hypothetical protein